jgi:hypothetical protein
MVTKNSTVNKPDGIRALENPVLKTHSIRRWCSSKYIEQGWATSIH